MSLLLAQTQRWPLNNCFIEVLVYSKPATDFTRLCVDQRPGVTGGNVRLIARCSRLLTTNNTGINACMHAGNVSICG